MAKKGARVIITLECTEAKKEGRPASRYTTTKNKRTKPEKMEISKFDPVARKHVAYKETKLK